MLPWGTWFSSPPTWRCNSPARGDFLRDVIHKHLHFLAESSMILPLSRKRYKISMPGDEEDREIIFFNYIFTENKCLDGNAY